MCVHAQGCVRVCACKYAGMYVLVYAYIQELSHIAKFGKQTILSHLASLIILFIIKDTLNDTIG